MCCFSIATAPSALFGLFARKPKLHVSGTRIFARLGGGVQWLAYSMTVATSSDVAMVLPLPVARAADDVLHFVDLSGCADLFDRLDDYFPSREQLLALARKSRGPSLALPTLKVHRVGSFDASFVPSLADMSRLDKRFRIPDDVWEQRSVYASYGFAVFKLRKGASKTIHPMAMRFETKEPGSIFFPTVHVHDGRMHEVAHYDHALTYQGAGEDVIGPGGDPLVARTSYRSVNPTFADNSAGLVVMGQPLRRIYVASMRPNTDVRVPL